MRSGKRGVVGREHAGPGRSSTISWRCRRGRAGRRARTRRPAPASSCSTRKCAQIVRHRGVDVEADDVAAAAALQRASRTAGPGLRPLPRSRRRCRAACGTCPGRPPRSRGTAGRGTAPITCSSGRKRDRASPGRRMKRSTERGHQASAPAVRSSSLPRVELQRRGRSRRLGMNGNGMRRIDRQRRQHREDLGQEALVQPGAVARPVSSSASTTAMPASRELARAVAARSPAGRASASLARCVDRVELLRRGQPVLARRRDAGAHLALAGRRRGPCRTRRGCWPRSTGSAAARAADGADCRPPPARAR